LYKPIMSTKFNFRFFFLILLFIPLKNSLAETETFNYTGAVQTWNVPSGVTSITITAYGGAGGLGYSFTPQSTRPKGGKVTATLSVTTGTTYYIYVGGQGGDATDGTSTTDGDGAGGFNGGANGGGGDAGGGGGGATDFRTSSALSDRILVAGGAGGNGGDPNGALGGAGGGTTAADGQDDTLFKWL
jgi:hypothetical protein